MSILAIESLSRSYDNRVGIDDINLQVSEGEIFGFLGPNGAGKSTTIRLLMGLMRPESGTATVCGLDCWRQSHRVKQHIGYLPGDLRLYPWMTARNASRIVSGARGKDVRQRVAELAERFELELNLPVRKMSRGTRQKLGLVLAMAHRPQLLVLDEPASGLDPIMQRVLINLLREGAADGQTVFFSSHTLSEVESLCHRVAIVRRGRLIVDCPLGDLQQRAPRQVRLSFATEAAARAAKLPDYLRVDSIDGLAVHAQMAGSSSELIAWASQQPLDDISIGQPDLETLFHTLYHEEGAAAR